MDGAVLLFPQEHYEDKLTKTY